MCDHPHVTHNNAHQQYILVIYLINQIIISSPKTLFKGSLIKKQNQ